MIDIIAGIIATGLILALLSPVILAIYLWTNS